MKKLFLLLLFVPLLGLGQTVPTTPPPVSPVQLNTTTWYWEPLTRKHFAYNGSTYLWWQPTDSIQVQRMINRGGGGGGFTIANNGLTGSGSTVSWGGSLQNSTSVTSTGHSISLIDTGASNNKQQLFLGNNALLRSVSTISGENATLDAQQGTDNHFYFNISATLPGGLIQISSHNPDVVNASTGILIQDNADLTGAHYNADYHTNGIANFGNRWIPDVGWVNSQIGSNTTIYTGDGTITGNRFVTLASDAFLGMGSGVTTSGAYFQVDNNSTTPGVRATAKTSSLGSQLILENGQNRNIFTNSSSTQELTMNSSGILLQYRVISGTFNQSLAINSASGMVIHDDWNNVGLVADASIDTATLSLTPKAYVTNEWVLGKLPSNGPTIYTGDGTTTSDRFVDIGRNELEFEAVNPGDYNIALDIQPVNGSPLVDINIQDQTHLNKYNGLAIRKDKVFLWASESTAGKVSEIVVDTLGTHIINDITFKDPVAKQNYGANLTSLSYITKHEADSLYTGAGGVPTSRTLTINGTTFDLSANRTWSVGTVTSVATGYGLSGGIITTSGTLLADTTSLSALVSKPRLATNLTGYAKSASPTFTGTVTIPTPFTLGATSVTSTGTQLNYLNAATGTTGTTSTNVVFSTSPTLVTPTLGAATATTINGNTFTTGTYTLTGVAGKTLTFNNSITLAGTDATTMTFPSTTATIARTDAAQTFANTQTFSGQVVASGTGMSTALTTSQANFFGVGASSIAGTSSNALALFAGASNTQVRGIFTGSTSSTLTANAAYSNVIIASSPVTLPGTGTTPAVASLVLLQVGTITNGSSIPLTHSATLWVDGAASGATTNDAVFVNNGNIRFGTAGQRVFITEGSNGIEGQTTLVSGTKAVTISGLTSSSHAFVQLVTPSGVTLTTTYQAVCSTNTLTIQANVAAGTINIADGSTLNYIVYN